jgi:MFS family permease
MRVFISIILIISLSALTTWFLPWWLMAVVSFLVALVMMLKPGKAFLTGFVSTALFWLIAILLQDIPNEHILSGRMAKLFGLPNFSLLIIINVILGGLIGGLAAWCAGLMNRAFRA